tara:strand:+ start:4334 stop:4780 length:447 start_codon:yes stop_codon:yes gene_type:complete
MYDGIDDYEIDKVIAIADKVIKVYGYCNTKGLNRLARMLKEKSDITGKPLPYEYYGDVVDYNNAYTTAERVKDYYNDFEMTDTDYQLVAKIKDGFKEHLFTIINGKDVPSYISLTMKLLNHKTIDADYVGLVASWPYTVNKKKEVVNA